MKIRQKFITLLLLIGVTPVLVVSVVAYLSFSNALLEKTTDQLSSTAIKQEQRISTYLQTRQEEVTKIANQYDLQVLIRQYLNDPSEQNKLALKTILQDKKVEVSLIESMFLTDLQGNYLVSSTDDVEKETVRGIKEPGSGEDTSVSVRNDWSDGLSRVYITSVISVNKKRTALLNVVFRTDELVAIVQDYTGLDETGETVVVDDQNKSLFPLRFDTDASLKIDLSSLGIQSLNGGKYHTAIDYRGHEVLVLSHQVGLSDWTVATKIDTSEALASITLLRNTMFLIVGAAVLVIIMVAIYFTRLFTRPILEVSRVSERIGRGDFSARADIDRKDELGTLASSVNTMGRNLRELIGNIESQRQRLQVILDSTTEAIFAIDADANIIMANRAVVNLLYVDPNELVGRNMKDVFKWQHGMQDFIVDYNVEDVHTYASLQYVDSKGSQRYVKLIVARIIDESYAGKAQAIVTIHDETSSHELENMKTDFVSMAAHELRTPLTAVRGYLEMVQYKQRHNDPKDTDKYVNQALKNVSDLGGLINNLLDVTRIERGTLTLSMSKVDIASEVINAMSDLKFVANERRINMSYDGAEANCFVVGDGVALREIVNNLVSNAIKYTKEGGSVAVSLQQEGDQYVVKVKDTGMGIPAQAIPHLFTKFYRVHGGLASGSSGTGLGLYIAKSIIERHKGTIGVESTEGVGSTFKFSIPVFTEENYKMAQQATDDNTDDVAGNITARRNRGWVTKNITR